MAVVGDKAHQLKGNRLLGALPEEELGRLEPFLEVVTVGFKETLYGRDEPISHVYFPINCVASMVAAMEGGATVEVGTVGNEGMVGLPVFLGRDTVPLQCFCQVPGEAVKMSSEALRTQVGPGSRLRKLLGRYTEAMFVFTAQSAACNRLHSVEQRASRWPLHTQDRVESDEFSLTHEFLAQMLGVRRASVSEVAGELRGEGLISYIRGTISVLDREGLEARSCECYDIINKEFDRVFD